MILNLPPIPDSLKPIQRFLTVANQFEQRDIAVSYWSRLHALQIGLKLDRKSKEAQAVVMPLLDWLEKEKAINKSSEIRTAAVAKKHIEDYAVKLLDKAYKLDMAEEYGKAIIQLFYTAGVLFDVLQQFGELSEEMTQKRKYAKWKTIYITNCLKNGEVPVPGPPGQQGENPLDDDDEAELQNFLGHDKHDQEKPESGSAPLSPVQPAANPIAPTPSTGGAGASSSLVADEDVGSPGGARLTQEQTVKAQKYCKWAESALSYNDEPTAVNYLTKALKLVQTGEDE